MDFIVSALEASEYGFRAYGLFPYAAGHADNFVFGLARAWCEKTATILDMEHRYPRRCLRVRYEELVTRTPETWSRLADFLGVPPELEVIDGALSRPHLKGYGDHKILATSFVNTDSLGRGRVVPLSFLSDVAVESMNGLMAALEYVPLSENWNHLPSELRCGLLGDSEQASVTAEFGSVLAVRAQALRQPEVASALRQLSLLVEEFGDPRGWSIDCASGDVRPFSSEPEDGDEQNRLHLIVRVRTLRAIFAGFVSVQEALASGSLRLAAHWDASVALVPSQIARLLLEPSQNSSPPQLVGSGEPADSAIDEYDEIAE